MKRTGNIYVEACALTHLSPARNRDREDRLPKLEGRAGPGFVSEDQTTANQATPEEGVARTNDESRA